MGTCPADLYQGASTWFTLFMAKRIQHIRRNDEIELTYCGLLTAVDLDGTSDAPIAIPGHPGQVAIYDDHEFLPDYAHCSTCHIKYEEI